MRSELTISEQFETDYRDYAYYVLEQRALPSVIDGLKNVQRRLLFVARSLAKNSVKIATLAGRTLPYHPHGDAPLCSACSIMAQEFCGASNFSYLEGHGAFGSKITGRGAASVGAPRYVSVRVSKVFEKLLLTDYDITEQVPNYDQTLKEVKRFLPIFPTTLLNPTSGIAVGFACEIHPYNPTEIIDNQIRVLEGKTQVPILPWYRGFDGTVYREGKGVRCKGKFEFLTKTKLRITELPVGYTRERYVGILDRLISKKKDYVRGHEDNSRESFDFLVALSRENPYFGDHEKLMRDFSLDASLSENLTVIGFDGKVRVYENIYDLVEEFTLWRLEKFVDRYEHRRDVDRADVESMKGFLKALDSGILKELTTLNTGELRSRLSKHLTTKQIEEFLQFPIRRFSKGNVEQSRRKVQQLGKGLQHYHSLLANEDLRRKQYIRELGELRKWFEKED